MDRNLNYRLSDFAELPKGTVGWKRRLTKPLFPSHDHAMTIPSAGVNCALAVYKSRKKDYFTILTNLVIFNNDISIDQYYHSQKNH